MTSEPDMIRPSSGYPAEMVDPELSAQIDQVLSTRRKSRHLKHRSSISLNPFRNHRDGSMSSAGGTSRISVSNSRARPSVYESDSHSEEEEDLSTGTGKRPRKEKKRTSTPSMPIQLLVRKAEPALTVRPVISPSIPEPRRSSFDSTNTTPYRLGGPSTSGSRPNSPTKDSQSTSSRGKLVESDILQSHPAPSVRARADSDSGEVVNLLAQQPEERQAAKEEVRKLKKGQAREYVWDVLFENQRGLMFLGTPYFSPATLFPMDPDPFTVPIHALQPVRAYPTTNKSAQVDPAPHNTLRTRPFRLKRRKRGHAEHGLSDHRTHVRLKNALTRGDKERKSMTTPYNLQTFQAPSSHWVWLTPWLVNMRQDGLTDERGWEYNYIFRKNGWGARVSWSGWGGWVRRRMWVRLRSLKVNEAGEEEEDWRDDDSIIGPAEGLELHDDDDPDDVEARERPYNITGYDRDEDRQM